MIFANWKFAEKNYSIEVLNWLAEQKVEEIIKKRDQVRMVHWLALFNNLYGVEWAFKKYQDHNDDLGEIFRAQDNYEQNIFGYAVNGVAIAENSSLNSQVGIIEQVLTEFKKVISDPEKGQDEQEMKNKKEEIADLLRKTCLTKGIEEVILSS